MAIRALKVFELLKQKLVNYFTIEGSPSRKKIQLMERIISMDNKDQFAFKIFNDVDIIFEYDEVEPIYEEEESLSSNEVFIPLEYAQQNVETCKEHPK